VITLALICYNADRKLQAAFPKECTVQVRNVWLFGSQSRWRWQEGKDGLHCYVHISQYLNCRINLANLQHL